MSTQTTVKSVAWLINIATPYRLPVWRILSGETQLVVLLAAETEANRTWDLRSEVRSLDVTQLHLPSLNLFGTPRYLPTRRLHRILSDLSASALVVDTWDSPAFLAAAVQARRNGAKVVALARSTEESRRFRTGPVAALRRWFFNYADHVVTAGQASTRAVLNLGVPPDRITTSFNVVDGQWFHASAAATRQAGTTADGHRYLYVGQLIERKNVTGLIKAFDTVAAAADSLTIVGVGPELSTLETQAQATGREIRFAGALHGDDLARAYGLSHTLVLPSTEEVWGLVANEGLAAGLHVIVTDVCGVAPDIDDMAGVIVTRPEVGALAAAMRQSKLSWRGWIASPEILRHGPEEFANAVMAACGGPRRSG